MKGTKKLQVRLFQEMCQNEGNILSSIDRYLLLIHFGNEDHKTNLKDTHKMLQIRTHFRTWHEEMAVEIIYILT